MSVFTFVLMLAPWIVRNFAVSGTPFGTAGFAIVEGTTTFPGFQLERSLHPDLSSALWLTPYVHKLLQNTRTILQDALPKLGGSWVSVLFLSGLLLSFRSAAVRRMRRFARIQGGDVTFKMGQRGRGRIEDCAAFAHFGGYGFQIGPVEKRGVHDGLCGGLR